MNSISVLANFICAHVILRHRLTSEAWKRKHWLQDQDFRSKVPEEMSAMEMLTRMPTLRKTVQETRRPWRAGP
jgi:hypothetical protein